MPKRPTFISPHSYKYRDTDSPCQCPKPVLCLCPTLSALHPAPPDTSTQPAANSQLCPSQLPSTQPKEQSLQVVLQADSNGKFLGRNKIFPDKKVLSKCCSTIGQAMKLLKKETLRSPQWLVIHTGTNDHSYKNSQASTLRLRL
eukprot:superscaffoldBa00003035_g15941